MSQLEEPFETRFEAKAGTQYRVWAKYSMSPPDKSKLLGDEKRTPFCYELQLEVLRDGKKVTDGKCWPFPQSNCQGKVERRNAECRSDCSFSLDQGGPATVRAKLVKTAKTCTGSTAPFSEGTIECGPKQAGCYHALEGADRVNEYRLRVEEPEAP